jgi:hypothetical protein
VWMRAGGVRTRVAEVHEPDVQLRAVRVERAHGVQRLHGLHVLFCPRASAVVRAEPEPRTSPDGDVEDRGPRVDALHVQRRERREPLRGLRKRVRRREQLRAVGVLILWRRRLQALVLIRGRGGRCACGGVSARSKRAKRGVPFFVSLSACAFVAAAFFALALAFFSSAADAARSQSAHEQAPPI